MKDFVESLQVIIVIYNLSLKESESFRSIHDFERGDLDLDVLVYDNSKKPQPVPKTKGLKIEYIHDPHNPGVSKAYNVGASHAHRNLKKWILLLDQDTALPPKILVDYQEAIDKNKEIRLFVPILKLKDGKVFSPCRYRLKRGFHLEKIENGIYSLWNLSPVNSGMMVDLLVFLEVGGYNERVKLDFSDFQFIERFRENHNKFYVLDTICYQDFSDDEGSYISQVNRYKYFCEGAKNIDKKSFWEWAQYSAVVFLRGIKLSIRYRKLAFMKTYLNYLFIKNRNCKPFSF